MAAFGGCCCGCPDGTIVDRWVNQTAVRPTGDNTADPKPNYTETPFPRNVSDADCPDGPATAPLGECGPWAFGGAANMVSAQVVENLVKDIFPCVADDATHKKVDLNCYVKSGTVNMRAGERKGGQWILARKFWHGRWPFRGVDGYGDNCAGTAPTTTKYRRIKRKFTASVSGSVGYKWFDAVDGCDPGTVRTLVNETNDFSWSMNRTTDRTVGQKSGVVASNEATDSVTGPTGSWSVNLSNPFGTTWVDIPHSGTGFDADGNVSDPQTEVISQATMETLLPCMGWSGPTTVSFSAYNGHLATSVVLCRDSLYPICFALDSVCDTLSSHFTGGFIDYMPTNWADFVDYVKSYMPDDASGDFTVSTSDVEFTATKMAARFTSVYSKAAPTSGDGHYGDVTVEVYFCIELSEPYTATQLFTDYNDLFKEWNMSDFTLGALREDELLASAPLCCYDEPNGVMSPDEHSTIGVIKVPDYSLAQVGGEWQLRDWYDPNSYTWLTPGGGVNGPMDTAGGNTLFGPFWDGSKISHNVAGSERHFDFLFAEQTREGIGGCTVRAADFMWFNRTVGAFSPSHLPSVTRRWMNKLESQYDAGPLCNDVAEAGPGNYPQAFINAGGGVITGAKYVEAAFRWPAVNYGRPCGPDRYAVDQATVCYVTSGSCAAGTLEVKATQGVTFSLAVNDYIASDGEGFYKLTGVTDLGGGTWQLTVGAKIEDLPTGWSMASAPVDAALVPSAQYVGRLRWVNFVRNGSTLSMPSPICGRSACTTAYAGGTVTVTFSDDQPNLRKDVTTGKVVVDLWNAAHKVKVAAAVELTRVSDTVFTYAAGSDPGAAWATGKDYTWTDFDETPQHTGIKLEYTFSNRLTQAGETAPDWFDGVAGCLTGDATEFIYNLGQCRAMVGIVPHYDTLIDTGDSFPVMDDIIGGGVCPVEDFKNQTIFATPESISADDKYGYHWQAEVNMVMPDPFFQTPFTPDGGIDHGTDTMSMTADDGSGQATTLTGETSIHYAVIYAHPRWVEAKKTPPTGKHLPDGVSLHYSHDIAPSYWLPKAGGLFTGGLPIGDAAGNYGSFETTYGFRNRAKAHIAANGIFANYYREFVS